MESAFRAVKVSENVYWVGAIDWELADFHGYATPRGSTYNAFLILDEKITLIDTVKAPFFDEMMSRIQSVIDPTKIDIIVSNHSEMDHTGALPRTVAATSPSQVYASGKGVKAISRHMDPGIEVTAVVEGDELSLGQGKLTFLMTSMVHWPDSMFAYYDRDGVLFSNDAFGMHLASTERWADELEEGVIRKETTTYYANILWPTSKAVQGVLKKVDAFESPINIIAPDHGPLWRENGIKMVLDWYRKWSAAEVDGRNIVILYDSMWGSTAKLAAIVADGVASGGASAKVLPLGKVSRADAATELLEASAVAVGSPNLNGGLFPTVADVLTYLKGLRPTKPTIPGAVFGSYGWSPAVFKTLATEMEALGVELLEDPLKSNYVPADDERQAAFALGEKLANATLPQD